MNHHYYFPGVALRTHLEVQLSNHSKFVSVSLLVTILQLSPSFLSWETFIFNTVVPWHLMGVGSRRPPQKPKLLDIQVLHVLHPQIERADSIPYTHLERFLSNSELQKSIMTSLSYQVCLNPGCCRELSIKWSSKTRWNDQSYINLFYSHFQITEVLPKLSSSVRGCKVQPPNKMFASLEL